MSPSRPVSVVTPHPAGLVVRPIEPALMAAFTREHPAAARSVTYRVGADWSAEDVGWFQGRVLAGVTLVLYRPVRGSRRVLAQVPDAPLLPWAASAAARQRWLPPLVDHLTASGAFAVRFGAGPALRLRARADWPIGVVDRVA